MYRIRGQRGGGYSEDEDEDVRWTFIRASSCLMGECGFTSNLVRACKAAASGGLGGGEGGGRGRRV